MSFIDEFEDEIHELIVETGADIQDNFLESNVYYELKMWDADDPDKPERFEDDISVIRATYYFKKGKK